MTHSVGTAVTIFNTFELLTPFDLSSPALLRLLESAQCITTLLSRSYAMEWQLFTVALFAICVSYQANKAEAGRLHDKVRRKAISSHSPPIADERVLTAGTLSRGIAGECVLRVPQHAHAHVAQSAHAVRVSIVLVCCAYCQRTSLQRELLQQHDLQTVCEELRQNDSLMAGMRAFACPLSAI